MGHHCTNSTYILLAGAFFICWLPAGVVRAQTNQQGTDQPSHIPNQRTPGGPFGNEWAKPGGTTGSYIYMDPRLRSPYRSHPRRGNSRCPGPTLYDPKSGACR